jgi:hypothetical protein
MKTILKIKELPNGNLIIKNQLNAIICETSNSTIEGLYAGNYKVKLQEMVDAFNEKQKEITTIVLWNMPFLVKVFIYNPATRSDVEKDLTEDGWEFTFTEADGGKFYEIKANIENVGELYTIINRK